jgi:hypothetical protein
MIRIAYLVMAAVQGDGGEDFARTAILPALRTLPDVRRV